MEVWGGLCCPYTWTAKKLGCSVVVICHPSNSNSITQPDVFCRQDVPTAQPVEKQGQHRLVHCILCCATDAETQVQTVRWWDVEAGIHLETAGESRAG